VTLDEEKNDENRALSGVGLACSGGYVLRHGSKGFHIGHPRRYNRQGSFPASRAYRHGPIAGG
jgi:hypothetical protein